MLWQKHGGGGDGLVSTLSTPHSDDGTAQGNLPLPSQRMQSRERPIKIINQRETHRPAKGPHRAHYHALEKIIPRVVVMLESINN